MKLKRYVEMEDTKNPDSTRNIVDIYGYDTEVIVWHSGDVETYKTKSLEETKKLMQTFVDNLMINHFVIINQEVMN